MPIIFESRLPMANDSLRCNSVSVFTTGTLTASSLNSAILESPLDRQGTYNLQVDNSIKLMDDTNTISVFTDKLNNFLRTILTRHYTMKKIYLVLILFCINFKAFAQTTFFYTGATQTFTVPSGVTSLIIDMQGAKGGNNSMGSEGGYGGRLQASYSVTPGDLLYINVGSAGGNALGSASLPSIGGAITGGTGNFYAGGGGGASDIRMGGTALINRIFVAGGGGGAGYNCGSPNEQGGFGGSLMGGTGYECNLISTLLCGQGGSQTSGGLGGTSYYTPPAGQGVLGAGANGIYSLYYSGAGGGGYYGGGAAAYGGGGGGSSYSISTATSVTHTSGYNSTGNGIVTINTSTPCSGSITAGSSIIMPASGNPGTLFSLAISGASIGSGLTFQWYSSPTGSPGTWTNISGATNAIYSFTGLSATTYFRCLETCSGSGSTDTSVMCNATYVSLCSGSVSPGNAVATPSYGSASTSIVLSLIGATTSGGLTYQWQSSSSGLSGWTSIPGATGATYSFTGLTSSKFFRCYITCIYSGFPGYSVPCFVSSCPIAHIADSFSVYINTTCPSEHFEVSTHSYAASQHIKTYFGSGTSFDTVTTNIGGIGYTSFNKSYPFSGTFTIKHVLYNGSTPVDSITYPHTVLFCSDLPVGFYRDALGTCVYSYSSDVLIPVPVLIEVDSNSSPIDTVSATSLLTYHAYGNPGDVYTFRVISYPGSISLTCPSSGFINDTLTSSVGIAKYFGFVCSSTSIFDLAENMGAITCNFRQRLDINLLNNYCSSEPAVYTLHFSPKYMFYGSIPAPDSITGTTAIWNFPGLSMLTSPKNIHVWLEVPASLLTPGDTVMTNCTITPIAGDLDTTNNVINRIDTVFSSYDPNQISVSPAGCIPASLVTQLEYTIMFENTGNDTAHNIYVLDTLPSNVDPNSLRLVSTSNTLNISKWHDASMHNIYKFEFPNINLPDSSHHNECEGMVIFKLNTLPGLTASTTITNRAGIYFDDNAVVMTNSTINVVGCFVNTNTLYPVPIPELYPNPATNELTITTGLGTYNSFTITNIMGQQLIQQTINATATKVNVEALCRGVYYVTFNGNFGTSVVKFVKMD